MGTVEDKQFYRLLFPEVRFCTDDELESWWVYMLRELTELKLDKVDKQVLIPYQHWEAILRDEKDRRVELAKHGAPSYKGENKMPVGRVEELKRYYTGDIFVSLFQRVTGFQIFPGGSNNKMKYRCTIHGEDKQPSGVLYMDKGRYYCFACVAGGDIFQLLYAFSPHLIFTDAVKQLYEWSHPGYEQTENRQWHRA